ncbi:MAG: glycosyltransferase family 4 protein [Planctomycetota bacterium]|nr:glycosyltransferase family 4 protein [Planctomycetota bacterium]
MRVLHVSSGRGPTGAAAAAMSDVKALLAAGHKAYLATRQGTGLMQACAAAGVPVLGGLKLGRGALRLLHLPHDAWCLRRLIREHDIDAVHVHRSDDQLLAGAALGRALSTTLVRTWHRDPKGVAWPMLGRLASHVDGCVCVAREHAATLRAAGARRSEFIQPGVDTELFRPAGDAAHVAVPEVRLVHVGRWKRNERTGGDRGQRAALEVFGRLPVELPWKGFLVGRGELADALWREAYGDGGLSEERVRFVDVGKLGLQEFAAQLGAFHLGLIFACGSDGTSRAGVELLACGVPLIVADVPGLRELAEDQTCALRQLPDDPAGWARAVAALLAEPERLVALRRAARPRAEQVHSLAARGAALAEFYRGG